MQLVLKKLFGGGNLDRGEARDAMNIMMTGKAPPEQVGAFLAALRVKGETIDEVVGCAEAMRSHALKLPIKRTDLMDTCGTGGDGMDTFNISTANGFVLAASGVGVVKHGNRSVSSKCGSADVLEALGVVIDHPPETVARAVDDIGFGFIFARVFHPAVKHVAGIRQSLGARTIFNLLGPLCNPALAKRQLIGIYDRQWLEKLAHVLKDLGSEEVMLVHGADGMDEISLSGPTHVAHLKQGSVKSFTLKPEDVGLKSAPISALKGGDATMNAGIILDILKGKKGPVRDIVVLNCAAALTVAGKAKDFREGRALAESHLDSGAAMQVLEKLRQFRG